MVPKRSGLGARLRRIIDNFIKKVGADTDPWERRFAEKFGIVLAGAILMTEFGIGPWTKKRARRAVSNLYKAARSTTVTAGDATDAVLIRLRKLVNAGKRFPALKKGNTLDSSKAWALLLS
jgi:putative DNA primase/helicase